MGAFNVLAPIGIQQHISWDVGRNLFQVPPYALLCSISYIFSSPPIFPNRTQKP